jgi:SH3 domain protein
MIRPIALALLFVSSIAQAETRYISDELTVPLRRGPTNAHKIIHAGLPSGTALEVIAEDKDAGFTQVRMQNGTDGWVPTQYLVAEPIARDRLVAATKRIETLTAEVNSARQTMKSEQSARSNAEGVSGDLNKQLKQLQTELGEIKRVSANAVATYEENKALKAHADQLQETVDDQAKRLDSLKSHELRTWLLTGGGLVVLGLISGVAIKSRPKSKDGW